MALIANVFWTCPRCETRNIFQSARMWREETAYEMENIPKDFHVRWGQACESCHTYRVEDADLYMPDHLKFPTPIIIPSTVYYFHGPSLIRHANTLDPSGQILLLKCIKIRQKTMRGGNFDMGDIPIGDNEVMLPNIEVKDRVVLEELLEKGFGSNKINSDKK